MLIYLNLPELLCNCSKEIINIFQLSQLLINQAADEFLDLYLKIIEENSCLCRAVCFFYYRKHTNNDKICLPPSSSCFQQLFHDWLNVLRYNWDLSNLIEHYYIISTASVIWQIDRNFSPFQSLSMLPFQTRMLKTTLPGLI